MRISELVAQLQGILAAKGDLLVSVGDQYNCWDAVQVGTETNEGDADPQGHREYCLLYGTSK